MGASCPCERRGTKGAHLVMILGGLFGMGKWSKYVDAKLLSLLFWYSKRVFPLSLKGEGDKGGKIENHLC